MQCSVEEIGVLERRITVHIPAQEIEPKIHSRLMELCREVRVHGFRPGKVPLKVVKGMYGARVRRDVLMDSFNESFRAALATHQFVLVGEPQIDYPEVKEGDDVQYTATFEIAPEFEVQGIDGLTVERYQATVTEADVDQMIETLRRQHINWVPVDRPAQAGDRLLIDYEGLIDGQPFEGGSGRRAPIILGTSQLIDGFEQAITGLSAGETTEFEVHFPADHPKLADKTVYFKVTAQQVEAPQLPEVDEQFVKRFEIPDGRIEAFRQAIHDNMARELAEGIKTLIQRQITRALLAANDIPLPPSLVAGQVNALAERMGMPQPTPSKDSLTSDALPEALQQESLKQELFGPPARQQVALNLILARLASAQQLKPDEARVRQRLATLASTYQEPSKVIQWYEKNPDALRALRIQVLEEQVLEGLLARATIVDKPSTFNEVMQSVRGTTSGVNHE